MFNRWLILYFSLSLVSVRAEDIGSIGDALEIGNPCGNYIITVERLIGGPPDRENYWDGTVHLQNHKNLTEAVVTLQLAAPATVIVDEKDGILHTQSNPYNITFFKTKDDTFNAKFHVRALNGEVFPHLKGLLLNGVDICPNLQEGSPAAEQDEAENPIAENSPDGTNCGRIAKGISFDDIWFISVYYVNDNTTTFKCGGVYIAPKHVLTTGNCVTNNGLPIDPDNLRVQVSFLKDHVHARNYSVDFIRIHEKFNHLNGTNDIAIMQISLIEDIDKIVPPVCLWNGVGGSEKAAVTANLQLVTRNQQSEEVTKTDVSIVSSYDCQQESESITPSTLCGEFQDNLEICSENNGGGLFVRKNDVTFLRGLLSVNGYQEESKNCESRNRNIFVDVGKYVDWIRDNTQ